MDNILYIELSFPAPQRVPINFKIETKKLVGKTGITSKGIATLMQALTYMYQTISLVANPLTTAVEATTYVTQQLTPVRFSQNGQFSFVIIENDGVLLAINPVFEYNFYDDFFLFEITSNKSSAWPKYSALDAGNTELTGNIGNRNIGNRSNSSVNYRPSGIRVNKEKKECCFSQSSQVNPCSGYIHFTPEFNISTEFDNANLSRAENDNYTSKISQFINSPDFSKALFLLSKINKPHKCEKKCKKCKKHQSQSEETTTTYQIQNMIVSLYQTCLSIQIGEISWEEGSEIVMQVVENMEKYHVKGCRSIFYFNIQNNSIYLQMVNRYALQQKDCSVAFIMNTAPDMPSGNTYDLVLSVSQATVDEDMSDAIYSPIVGTFSYTNM